MDEQGQTVRFCPSCGAAQPGSRFCRKCGASLVRKSEAAQVELPASTTAPPAPAPPVPGARPITDAGSPARDTAAVAKKEAKISNLLAVPGFLLFLAGLVFLGISFVNQGSNSGNLSWGLAGIACLLVGTGLLIGALVFSILHWRDRVRARR